MINYKTEKKINVGMFNRPSSCLSTIPISSGNILVILGNSNLLCLCFLLRVSVLYSILLEQQYRSSYNLSDPYPKQFLCF